MKAFYMQSYGGPEVMKYGELPDPVPGPGEVRVSVKASSINPVDWKIRTGDLAFVTGRRFPRPLGSDLAGVVEAVGPGVTGFQPGDSVYGGATIFFGKPGAHAEKVVVASKQLRRMPTGLTFQQAASLPVAALTATSGLRQCGDLAGKEVLVNGATGGVGHFALQVAKARGARVTAVCSGRNAELARSLGADEVIDYTQQDFTRSGRQYDVIYDAFGMLGLAKAAPAMKPRSSYATTLPGPRVFFQLAWTRLVGGRRVVLSNMRDKPEDYAELEDLLARGAVKPVIENVFPLERAAEAFATSEAGKVRGKVVLTVG